MTSTRRLRRPFHWGPYPLERLPSWSPATGPAPQLPPERPYRAAGTGLGFATYAAMWLIFFGFMLLALKNGVV